MRPIKTGLWIIIFCAIVGTAVEAYMGKNPSESGTTGAQDVTGLDRRISSLEQRLYSIESSISRLQQQSTVSERAAQSPVRDPEINRLRSEVEILNARVRELVCGVAHLDERTLSATQRRAGDQSKDPCRLNPETPVRLSTRQ